eukprot:scaffold110967_cov40-Tisochrysis_lutea.AAC.3
MKYCVLSYQRSHAALPSACPSARCPCSPAAAPLDRHLAAESRHFASRQRAHSAGAWAAACNPVCSPAATARMAQRTPRSSRRREGRAAG